MPFRSSGSSGLSSWTVSQAFGMPSSSVPAGRSTVSTSSSAPRRRLLDVRTSALGGDGATADRKRSALQQRELEGVQKRQPGRTARRATGERVRFPLA